MVVAAVALEGGGGFDGVEHEAQARAGGGHEGSFVVAAAVGGDVGHGAPDAVGGDLCGHGGGGVMGSR